MMYLLIYEDHKLGEIHPIPPDPSFRLGNIYIGRVEKVVKNIRSAFVRLDREHVGYLPLDDEPAIVLNRKLPKGLSSIAEGDLILVQAKQEPQKLKQARVTGNISLSGDYTAIDLRGGIGVSKKIRDPQRVSSLKQLLSRAAFQKENAPGALPDQDLAVLPVTLPDIGCVLRTACERAEDADILSEYVRLCSQMYGIVKRAAFEKRSGCIMEGRPEYLAILQEYGLDRISEVKTDLREVQAELADKVHVLAYQDPVCPLYKLVSLETELDRLLKRHVWLKSGGFLVIEPTEAMVVIDVNSGKSVGKRNYQTHILQTNLEAADEITRQMRLRNLSGMIMVDFINMEAEEHRKQVIDRLESGLRQDKIPSCFVDVTRLGVFELTRQKKRKPLYEYRNLIQPADKEDTT